MIPNAAHGIRVIEHHLRLFGAGGLIKDGRVTLLCSPGVELLEKASQAVRSSSLVVALLPELSFCIALGVESKTLMQTAPIDLQAVKIKRKWGKRLRSLHPVKAYSHPSADGIVRNSEGSYSWIWLPIEKSGVLFIGTDLANDLIRFRQGDPAQNESRQTEAMWGFSSERPNYLFDPQRIGLDPHERQADYWVELLASFIADKLSAKRAPMLPGNALGAVILTGDDDQAYLEKYTEQLNLIGNTPITYFLHPLTRHTKESLEVMKKNHRVDFGIHPDALDAPKEYPEILAHQVRWYEELAGSKPDSLRNHGYLNDGYWGHLPSWNKNEIRISSNLPGVDGQVINGSLLPARVYFDNILTSHWSILTALGDGIRFAQGKSDKEAAQRISDLADSIKEDGIPGIIVLNLHPQNISETREMHYAALELIRNGLVAMSFADCINWFSSVDSGKVSYNENGLIRLLRICKRWKL